LGKIVTGNHRFSHEDYKRLAVEHINSPLNPHFPMVFLWFSYGFPTTLWSSFAVFEAPPPGGEAGRFPERLAERSLRGASGAAVPSEPTCGDPETTGDGWA